MIRWQHRSSSKRFETRCESLEQHYSGKTPDHGCTAYEDFAGEGDADGNQGRSGEEHRQTAEWLNECAIGALAPRGGSEPETLTPS